MAAGGILTGLLLFSSSMAWAHAFPDHSEPRVGSDLKAPPSSVKIWFDSELEPLFSTIEVFDAQQHKVDNGDGGVNAKDHSLLEVTVSSLAPGAYTVSWRVVSHDGHPTEGRFPFTVSGAR
ncbi:MAG TPA: copper resistance protein CopC [Nitrospiria bacterium]|nr:copper resistance protein CopC [Nitrospiria bacterium]